MLLDSIQIGRVVSEGGDADADDPLARPWTTGFYKLPVQGPVQLTRLGLVGDSVASKRFHGGPEKAVLCYAADHYRRWAQEHPQLDMSPGAFAENLTISGADESTVCIGDQFQIGQCVIEISQPRQPCWKISRRWGVKTLTKEVTESGRTGWYARVIAEGTIEAGQEIINIARPHAEWSVARANDVMFGRQVDRLAVIELMNLEKLSDEWKKDIS